jgi:glycosyltransferase involved in cell wall biosynthesis
VRVVAFTRYGREAASTRQRLLQYIPALNAAGIEVRYEPLLSDEYVRNLATGRSSSWFDVLRAYLKRARTLLAGPKAEIVWVYAENFPLLPGWFELLALSRSRTVIYDMDDAFFHNYDSSPKLVVRALLGKKLQPLLRRASACCCGNAYLEGYASRFCRKTMIVPTVVDTDAYKPRTAARGAGEPLVIGWIGSPTTWRYLRPLLPILQDLVRERGVRVRVVGAGWEAEKDRFPGLDLVEWTESGEVGEVQRMDIGIMPVPDEIWALGKSGYKLIQYMACGLPVVASPIGVNRQIVRHGETGFQAATPEEWSISLRRLLDEPDLRARMGSAGRRLAEGEYSLKVHAPRLIELFKSVAEAESTVGGRNAS